RNAHQDHLAILQRHEAVIEVASGNRNVLAKPKRVVLVDPGVVARLDAPVLEAFKPRPGIFVELPALGTGVSGCFRTIERSLAHASIKADEVSAGLRPPRDSVRVDVAAANPDAGFRNSVELGKFRLRVKAHEARLAGKDTDGVPDRSVFRMWHHGIRARAPRDARVLAAVGRLAGVGVVIELAVAIGVEHERRPALRLLFVAGFPEYSRVDPTRHRTCAAEPQRVVRVVAKLRMMGPEARVNEGVLHCFRIEHRNLTAGPLERKYFC